MDFTKLFLILLVVAGHVTHGGYHVVFTEVSEGRLRGITGRSAGGRMFYAYKGIPYASPPVGPLRWQPPQPPKPWHGVRSAIHDGPACAQYIILTEIYFGEEDCLYLNVYVPPGATNAPIIVWIHGGAFTAGSGRQDHYNPDFLLDLDVVVVTVNYRLGALGFLSTGDDLLPGNYGLKDQAAALRWLQRNAHAFGGDPRRVTLLGQSSGAACVTLHLLSPQSQGLFSGVAALSGSAIAAWAVASDPGAVFEKVARVVGCAKKDSRDDEDDNNNKTPHDLEDRRHGNSSAIGEGSDDEDEADEEDDEGATATEDGDACGEKGCAPPLPETREQMLECLRRLPPITLVQTLYKFPWWGLRMPVPFVPAVEKQGCEREPRFLPDEPLKLIQEGRVNAVPLVTGITSAEGLCVALATFVNPTLRRKLRWRSRHVFNRYVTFGRWSQADLVKLRRFYLGCGSPGTLPDLRLSSLTRLFSDGLFTASQTRFARLWAHATNMPVFFYVFAFEGRAAQVMQHLGLYPGPYGVDHGDDLPYLFDDSHRPFPGGRDQRERVAARLWTAMLVNFADSGNPTPEQCARAPVTWRQIGPGCAFRFLRFSDAPAMVEGLPFAEAVELWDYVEENPTQDSTSPEDADEREEAEERAAAKAAERAAEAQRQEARRLAEANRTPAIQRADELAEAAHRYERRRAALERRHAEMSEARAAALAEMRARRAEEERRAAERREQEQRREERKRMRALRKHEDMVKAERERAEAAQAVAQAAAQAVREAEAHAHAQSQAHAQAHDKAEAGADTRHAGAGAAPDGDADAAGHPSLVIVDPAELQAQKERQQIADAAWEKAVKDAMQRAEEEKAVDVEEPDVSEAEIEHIEHEMDLEKAKAEETALLEEEEAEKKRQAAAEAAAEAAAKAVAAKAAAEAKAAEEAKDEEEESRKVIDKGDEDEGGEHVEEETGRHAEGHAESVHGEGKAEVSETEVASNHRKIEGKIEGKEEGRGKVVDDPQGHVRVKAEPKVHVKFENIKAEMKDEGTDEGKGKEESITSKIEKIIHAKGKHKEKSADKGEDNTTSTGESERGNQKEGDKV